MEKQFPENWINIFFCFLRKKQCSTNLFSTFCLERGGNQEMFVYMCVVVVEEKII